MGQDEGPVEVASPPTSSPTATAPTSAAPTPSESATATGTTTSTPVASGPSAATGSIAVPVYFVADAAPDDSRLRLYREFHRVEAAKGDATRAALEQLLAGAPIDPDYRSLWPKGTKVLDYRRSGSVATVDLSGQALDGTASAQDVRMGLQQLVWTVTAAEQDAALQVRLRVEGKPVDRIWGATIRQPLTRAAKLDVQGLIWILTPAEGARVPSPVAVDVYGTAYEGTVVHKAFDSAGAEVASTFVTAGGNGTFGEAKTTLDLPAGNYVLRAYETSGKDDSLTERDSKAFVVR
jgi:spore germination protein GerM